MNGLDSESTAAARADARALEAYAASDEPYPANVQIFRHHREVAKALARCEVLARRPVDEVKAAAHLQVREPAVLLWGAGRQLPTIWMQPRDGRD